MEITITTLEIIEIVIQTILWLIGAIIIVGILIENLQLKKRVKELERPGEITSEQKDSKLSGLLSWYKCSTPDDLINKLENEIISYNQMHIIAPGLAEQDKPRIDDIKQDLEIVKKLLNAKDKE
jgi:hypothetical protein